ncbi:hypothetical protein cyc_01501 [Cyclospora cayetanensis]|uniref:Uncharacterized protein n=1 Tax=Cyclospora cayetanensis TaxID=88456 RepID=A0A1D3D6W3_9EIME|nr:hypothetical protein cyc_01501 [Cyclospora cayetanensis]
MDSYGLILLNALMVVILLLILSAERHHRSTERCPFAAHAQVVGCKDYRGDCSKNVQPPAGVAAAEEARAAPQLHHRHDLPAPDATPRVLPVSRGALKAHSFLLVRCEEALLRADFSCPPVRQADDSAGSSDAASTKGSSSCSYT